MFKAAKKIWAISSFQGHAREAIIGEWQFDVGMLDKAEFFEMSEQVYEDLERAGSLDKEHFTLSIKTKLIERGYVV